MAPVEQIRSRPSAPESAYVPATTTERSPVLPYSRRKVVVARFT
jgi:hypothetical protein